MQLQEKLKFGLLWSAEWDRAPTPLSIYYSFQHSAKLNFTEFIFLVGLFEQHEYNSTIVDDLEAPIIFQKAVDYIRHEMILQNRNMRVALDGYTHNITNRDGFSLSQYSKLWK